MTSGMTRIVLAVLVAVGLVVGVAACSGIPKGTAKQVAVGPVTLKATGAGIVRADADQTTFKIKCGVCGYEAAEMTIPTPKPGAPYSYTFKCPRCGHVQTVTIEAVGS